MDARSTDDKPKPLTGAALGGVVSMVLSLASDFATPLGKTAPLLLLLSCLLLAVTYLLSRKIKHHAFTTAWQFSTVCALVFLLLVLGQAFNPSKEKDRGIIAANVPVVAIAQSHVLPLTPAQKGLFNLEDALKSDDLGTRLSAATAALSSNGPDKQAAIDLIFASSDSALKAVAMEEAIKAKYGSELQFVVPDSAPNNSLAQAVRATRFRVLSVSPDGRSFRGTMISPAGDLPAGGTVSSHGISMAGTTTIDGKQAPLGIDAQPSTTGDLVGHAYSGPLSTPVTVPLI